jgi:hypothetical protein
VPTPLTHPLPRKPTTSGSSYRPPPKRERSPEPLELKRPPPRTDWPPTFPSAEARLQGSVCGADLSIQKIIFNSDGSQIALICANISFFIAFVVGLKLIDQVPTKRCESGRTNRRRLRSRGWLITRQLPLRAGLVATLG